MTRQYRLQIRPDAAKAADCGIDIVFVGRLKSENPAKINPHFIKGAQKKMVLGPVSLSQNGRKRFGTNLSTDDMIKQ